MEILIYVVTWILLLSLLFWSAVLLYLYRRLKKYQRPQDYSSSIPTNVKYTFVKSYEDAKQKKLPLCLEHLTKKNVAAIYLIHGTFVGDDPFQIFALLESIVPEIAQGIVKNIKEYSHSHQQLISKDLGNFTSEHVAILVELENSKIPVTNYTWSSGNHHMARLRGCLDLLDLIAKNQNRGERILLLGHSHAGQIFCLISILLNNKPVRDKIFEIFGKEEISTFKDIFIKLKSIKYDFVTMGTPIRYKWQLANNMRLIHFINHRGEKPIGGGISGMPMTLAGDYIQQWGISGSDIKSPIKNDVSKNLRLDEILGVGQNIKLLQENAKYRRRLHDVGKHILVDYQDQAIYPNFVQTILGHGVYTRKKLLSFHLSQIIKEFY